MTTTELTSAIEIIRKSKLEDIKGRITIDSNSSFFIVVYKDGAVRRQSNLSFVFSGDFTYAIMIVYFGYTTQKVWSKTSWEFGGFLTPNSIISSIQGINWSITDIGFGFTRHGNMAPSFVFKFNNDQEKYVTYETTSDRFDLAWKFFLELDKECTSYEEATFYQKYYDERLRRNELELTVESYKSELIEKNSIIYQYKDLLKLIEEKTQTR